MTGLPAVHAVQPRLKPRSHFRPGALASEVRFEIVARVATSEQTEHVKHAPSAPRPSSPSSASTRPRGGIRAVERIWPHCSSHQQELLLELSGAYRRNLCTRRRCRHVHRQVVVLLDERCDQRRRSSPQSRRAPEIGDATYLSSHWRYTVLCGEAPTGVRFRREDDGWAERRTIAYRAGSSDTGTLSANVTRQAPSRFANTSMNAPRSSSTLPSMRTRASWIPSTIPVSPAS